VSDSRPIPLEVNRKPLPAEALRRPRVLLIANSGWYLRNFRARLIERLEAGGLEVILAAPPDAETEADFFRQRRFEPLHFSRSGRNPLRELLVLLAFMRLFWRLRPKRVFTWTPKPNLYGCLAGRLLSIPVIPNVSGLGFVFIRNGLMARFLGCCYRFAFKRAPLVFFQNEEDRRAFLAARWVNAAQAQRLPGSGVDLEHFDFRPLPPPAPFVFLYMGRLLADKGLRELVEAAAKLRRSGHQFVLRVAGFSDPGNPTAISQAGLDKWIAEGAVEYLGSLKDVRPAVATAHCVVLPSYREGVPRSLLEAAAMGRPVIASDTPGCRDALLPDVSGLLCKLRDADSLAACMAQMLGGSAERLAAMGRAGRKHVEERFSEERVLDAYLSQCESLCDIGAEHGSQSQRQRGGLRAGRDLFS
jgi:glycosyltransferase involved in cell wall biosynthesis